MIGKLLVLVLALFALLQTPVEAELYFNRLPSKPEQVAEYGLKCVPGRTVIRVEQPKIIQDQVSVEDTRRTHMNAQVQDELCKICVCSVEGKDEYCSRRPARNVNECIRMAILNKNMQSNAPFSHERALSYRIRRDYIWHRDEIPYEAKASCRRGTSYYSNSVTANNTDIDVASDIDSLLDYSNKDICFYCVCSTDGRHAGCINRDPWFCEYYRIVRDPRSQRENYRILFKQDRPAYFRQLSYRLRRTMDDGMEALLDFVGDDYNNTCIPFVSEYSDCSEANKCTGCNKCSCTAEAQWSCETVLECPDNQDVLSEAGVSNALDMIYSKMYRKESKPKSLVPPPPAPEDELLGSSPSRYGEEFKDFQTFFSRQKRSVKSKTEDTIDNGNRTVKFYHTVDEMNEDTLKGLNNTGTIPVQKVDINRVPKISRRTSTYDNFNKSDFNALHIEYNQPQEYDHHISENKIETHHGDKLEYNEEKLNNILGNFSNHNKDTILSKIVVNELKGGSEIIGDKGVSPMSNITFTPENDTLTAMAFIAGNLLNKLWNMEMESTDFSIETEVLKHEKINDLLDLFREPLSIRQENFIKNALEKLSDTLSKNRNVKNVSLCETITNEDTVSQEESSKNGTAPTKCIKDETKNNKVTDSDSNTTEAISKLNNVLGLIKKFEHVQNSLNDLRIKSIAKQTKLSQKSHTKVTLTAPENSSLKLFGNLLEKITKLLIPNGHSKKVLGKMEELNQLKDSKSIKSFVKNKYGINIHKKEITAKDKLILDYLNHIENNPNCLLKKNLQNIEPKPTMNMEGNILYNLSEFFKVKSFIDLVKLIKPNIISKTETKVRQEVSTILPKPFAKIIKEDTLHEQKNFNATKEKIKNHLKALIDDMIELQNVRGVNKEQTKINIADALPCIYNILKTDTVLGNDDKYKTSSSLDKIKNVLNSIKLELKSGNPFLMTRRSNLVTEKPQSFKIWERVIKNINNLQIKTRRSFKDKPEKSYEELKNIMDHVEAIGNSYKNFAMLSVVPPEKQLMLLKTLEADTKQEKNALEALTNSMEMIASLPLEKRSEIKEFIDNSRNNINLSVKVLSNIDKSKQKVEENPLVEVFNSDQNKKPINELETQNISEILAGYKSNNNVKLTRDQIVKQLIQKRIEYYLKSREEVGINPSDDVNYNIGKRILFLMKSGNYNVAKELFKVFVANKRKDDNISPKKRGSSNRGTSIINEQRTKGRLLLALKDPLIRFEEPARDPQNQEHLFKQLLTFKNLS